MLRDGAPAPLTPKAFETLLALIEAGGQVVEKDELMRRIWPDTVVEENNLAQCVSALRKALGEEPGEHRYVVTVPGQGYRFVASVRELDEEETERVIRERPATGDAAIAEARPELSGALLIREIKRHKRGALLALTTLVIAVAGIAYFTRGDRPIDSVAVLPFASVGADPNTEYLADGITESLISNLSQLSHLKVISRNSAFRYNGRDIDPQAVGRELKVQAVITGQIVQRGSGLAISLELVDARDNRQLWGAQYHRELSDLLHAQAEISRDISEKLRFRLTSGERQRLTKRYTENSEAYQLYEKGRYSWNKRTGEGHKQAIEYFNQAIELDPGFALAYAGLANCYVLGGSYQSPGRETRAKARAAATRALMIDEELAEAHASLAEVILFDDWDFAAAEREFKRAIELNENYETAHHWYAMLLAALGRFDKAFVEIKSAQALDPTSRIIPKDAGVIHYYARQYHQAISQFQNALELQSDFYPAHSALGDTYLQLGKVEEAITELQKAGSLAENRITKAALGYAYAV